MSGYRSAQAADRAASAAGALALAADAGLCRALRGTGAARGAHRAPTVCGEAEGIPLSARDAVGAGAVAIRCPGRGTAGEAALQIWDSRTPRLRRSRIGGAPLPAAPRVIAPSRRYSFPDKSPAPADRAPARPRRLQARCG